MDARAFAAPKGLRPRRRVKPGHDELRLFTRRFLRRFPQASPAQAILARNRHRQSRRFVLAPACAGRITLKFGAASGTGETAEGGVFFPICHEALRSLALFFMSGSPRTTVYSVATNGRRESR
jgi:hypothetical protein